MRSLAFLVALVAVATAVTVVAVAAPFRPAPRRPRSPGALLAASGDAHAAVVPAGRSPPPPAPPRTRPAVAAAVAVGASGLALGPPGAAIALAVAVAAPRWRRQREMRLRSAAVESELPEVVDLLALAVGAGLTVPQAVTAVAQRGVGPLSTELGAVARDVARGRRLADALDELPGRAGEPARPLAATLGACERYGAPVADALDRLAGDARNRQRRRAEQAARRLPVLLLFPLVLCILPAFALVAIVPLIADAVPALRL